MPMTSQKEIEVEGELCNYEVNVWEDEDPDCAEDEKFSISIEEETSGIEIEFSIDDTKEIIKGLQDAIKFIRKYDLKRKEEQK